MATDRNKKLDREVHSTAFFRIRPPLRSVVRLLQTDGEENRSVHPPLHTESDSDDSSSDDTSSYDSSSDDSSSDDISSSGTDDEETCGKLDKEVHPRAFFKIRPPLRPVVRFVQTDAKENRSVHPPLHTASESDDSSSPGTDDEDTCGEDEKVEIAPEVDINEGKKTEAVSNSDATHTPKHEGKNKAESCKIEWTFKRKKKKKMVLKVPLRSRKILLLGDMNCGKTNLITTYCCDRYMEQYSPTILHYCHSDAKAFGRTVELILADVSGRDDFKPLRQCSYFKTDIAILCYSAGDRKTLERISSHWLPELNQHIPKCPFLIAETKKDIRDEFEDRECLLEEEGKTDSPEYREVCREMEKIVPKGMGAQVAKQLGAEGFHATSARYRVGTRGLFQAATVAAMKKSRHFRK